MEAKVKVTSQVRRKRARKKQPPKPRNQGPNQTSSHLKGFTVLRNEFIKKITGIQNLTNIMIMMYIFHLFINGIYWGYDPLTNHLLTS